MLDLQTARELAQYAVDHLTGSDRGNQMHWCLHDSAEERPWGWIFKAAPHTKVIGGAPKPDQPITFLSVDRFSGKTQIGTAEAWGNECILRYDVLLLGVGPTVENVCKFLSQLKNWTHEETLARLHALPTVVATGPMTATRPIHDALINRNCDVLLTENHA